MLKHVLVPLDGSQLAEDALKYARNIVDPGGMVTLVAAIDMPEAAFYGYYPTMVVTDYQKAVEDMIPTARHYLESIAADLRAAGLHVALVTDVGDPADVITSTAVKNGVDAIVISTHGRSGLGRWLLGSVTNKVLSAKACPVFVIPSKVKSAEKAQSA